MSEPAITVGARVRAKHDTTRDDSYMAESLQGRRILDGHEGTAVERQRGHGECWRIEVETVGEAWFDTDELTLLDPAPAPSEAQGLSPSCAGSTVETRPAWKPAWKHAAEAQGLSAASESAGAPLTTSHVATLPDGTRVNLPAGTVLREGKAK